MKQQASVCALVQWLTIIGHETPTSIIYIVINNAACVAQVNSGYVKAML
jgi:hypothetical protein